MSCRPGGGSKFGFESPPRPVICDGWSFSRHTEQGDRVECVRNLLRHLPCWRRAITHKNTRWIIVQAFRNSRWCLQNGGFSFFTQFSPPPLGLIGISMISPRHPTAHARSETWGRDNKSWVHSTFQCSQIPRKHKPCPNQNVNHGNHQAIGSWSALPSSNARASIMALTGPALQTPTSWISRRGQQRTTAASSSERDKQRCFAGYFKSNLYGRSTFLSCKHLDSSNTFRQFFFFFFYLI